MLVSVGLEDHVGCETHCNAAAAGQKPRRPDRWQLRDKKRQMVRHVAQRWATRQLRQRQLQARLAGLMDTQMHGCEVSFSGFPPFHIT